MDFLVNSLEHLLGLWVARVLVRVIFERQATVFLLNLLIRGGLWDVQQFVQGISRPVERSFSCNRVIKRQEKKTHYTVTVRYRIKIACNAYPVPYQLDTGTEPVNIPVPAQRFGV